MASTMQSDPDLICTLLDLRGRVYIAIPLCLGVLSQPGEDVMPELVVKCNVNVLRGTLFLLNSSH